MSLVSRIVSLAEGIAADIKALAAGKVDKVAGRGLSSADFSSEEKTKLALYPKPGTASAVIVANTVDIGAIDASFITISGNSALLSLGSSPAGTRRLLTFTGPFGQRKLIYNATSMIIPGYADLTLSGLYLLEVLSLGSGNWRVVAITMSNGTALVGTPFTGGYMYTAINEASIAGIDATATFDLLAVADANTLILMGTSTVTITSMGVARNGTRRLLMLRANITLKSSEDIVLPGGADIICQDGDIAEFCGNGYTKWQLISYLRGAKPV